MTALPNATQTARLTPGALQSITDAANLAEFNGSAVLAEALRAILAGAVESMQRALDTIDQQAEEIAELRRQVDGLLAWREQEEFTPSPYADAAGSVVIGPNGEIWPF